MEMKKKKDQNQSIYVTLIVILVALAVAVGITSVVGKRMADPEAEDVLRAEGEGDNEDAFVETEDSGGSPVFEDKTETEKDGSEGEEADSEEAVNTEPPIETEKAEESADAAAEDTAEVDALPEFASPVSGYLINGHSDTVPVFSVTMNDYRTHTGVDIFAEPGEAVCAAADGVIGAIWEDPMMGTCMTVVHSGGAVSTYKGIYQTIPDGIAQGVAVTKGQPIAAVGDTALAEVEEESHVHYELAVDGVSVDPCLYMEFNEEIYENVYAF